MAELPPGRDDDPSTPPVPPDGSTPPIPGGGEGRPPRVTVALEIEYRSAGAFLVAYSTNLSKGGLFIETETPLPVDSQVSLRLHAPDTSVVEIEGVVAWVREEEEEGRPRGMGIELGTPPERYGAVVDEIVARFTGIRILLGTAEPAPRAILTRYLRSIMACDIIEIDYGRELQEDRRLDLAVLDLDSSGEHADRVIRALRASEVNSRVPIIVVAQQEKARLRAAELGADEATTNPPSFAELQAAVIRCLSRPESVR